MNIEGLDYNTQREHLKLPEYGREIYNMIKYAIELPTKEERQRCAETIIRIMDRMFPENRSNEEYKQKLWDHLAIMSDFKLDIDYPYDVSEAAKINTKPQPIEYPMTNIKVKHYGKMLFKMFDTLKEMEPGEERDRLTAFTANQMKINLLQWSHGSCDDEKIASDLARYTDGVIQLDLNTFKFDKINEKDLNNGQDKKKKKK